MVSVDEKTGIQALERAGQTLPMQENKIERREYNYIRHGVLVLIANLKIANGQLLAPSIGPTRTEIDFKTHIEQTVATDPTATWVFILDQLNTHKSASLVEWVAQQIADKQDLGKKGSKGILKSMKTRKQYLENKDHRIRFVYVPKHCSWLNLIECWFASLSRRVLRRGNFNSLQDLEQKLNAYIQYYNEKLAKKFNWNTATKKQVKELVEKVKKVVVKFAP